jgi:hypothetical protein
MKPPQIRPLLPPAARFSLALLPALFAGAAEGPLLPPSDPYVFRSVVIGGGGFVTGIVFNPAERGLVYLRTDVGGAYRQDADARQWAPLLDWVGQADWNLVGVESLACDPSEPGRVYAAAGTYNNPGVSDGEILRSDDRGASWKRTPVPFKFGANEAGRNNGERLAVDPNDGRVLLIGTRSAGLWRSADRGASWARVASFPEFDEVLLPTRFPGGYVFPAQRTGINIIRFDGRSGRRGEPTPVIYAAASTPNASIFRSADAGATWSAVPGQPLGLRPTRSALSAAGILYVAYGSEPGPNSMTDGALWKLDTATGAWTDITPEKPAGDRHFGYGSVAVDALHPDTVLAGTWNHYYPLDEIFRSTDAGRTWVAILGGAQWDHASAPYTAPMNRHWLGDVEIDPLDSDHAIFTTGFGIWVTRDLRDADQGRPTRWSFDDQGIEETVPTVLLSPPSGPHLLSGVADVDGFRHDDLSASPPAGRFGTPAFKDTSSMAFAWARPEVVVRSGNTYKNDLVTGAYSADGGATWKAFASEPPGTVGAYWRGEGPITVSADAKTIVWSPTGVAPHLTLDRGATWFPCVGGSVNLAVVADTLNPSRFYAYDTEAGTIVVSTDGARSFKAVSGGLPVVKGRWGPAPGRLAAVPGREGEIWVIAGGTLLHSVNSGASLAAAKGVTAELVGFGKAAPGRRGPAVFIAGRVAGVEGLFRSDDSGASWVRITDERHGYGQMRALSGDPRIYGRVYFGTGGRGVLYGDRAGH